ncbi:unnamed protein product [Caenorhabditis nigoni]
MLYAAVKQHFLDNVFMKHHHDPQLGTKKHSVLVLDKSGMDVVNSCFKIGDVASSGILLVEDLAKRREPMASVDAIYVVAPVAQSIDSIIKDFPRAVRPESQQYRSANIYFLEPCNDDLFKKIADSPLAKHIKTIVEINVNFLPIESQVFTVSKQCNGDMMKIADGIASLCATLCLKPTLRFHSDFAQSAEICYRIDQKLKEMGSDKPVSTDAELVVMDRSIDLVTPLLHELTLQAMAADLTDYSEGIYRYRGDSREEKILPLDETDELWEELRHQHLADILKRVHSLTKDLKQIHAATSSGTSAKEVKAAIHQLPAFLKKKARVEAYLNLAEECRGQYFNCLEKIILLEQDMAVEHTPEGAKISDSQAVNRLSTFIMQPTLTTDIRLRLILIFMLTIGKDKDEQFFNRLLHHTDIPDEEFQVVKKMLNWRDKAKASAFQRRRPPPEDERFPTSRWDPKIRNIIQEIHAKRLDEREFKLLGQKSGAPELRSAMSARYGGGLTGRPREKRKIILFLVGGVTYSEMKTVYEMSKVSNTTILLGSDSILTPSNFIESLRGPKEQ